MMSYMELQKELRSIGKKIGELESAVEQMKSEPAEEQKSKYNAIVRLANKYPLTGRRLDVAGENTRSMYLKMLASIAGMEERFFMERLLYISRIAAGMSDKNYSAEKIPELIQPIDEKNIGNFLADLEAVKDYFMIDALVVVFLCGEPSKDVEEFIGEIIVLLKYDKDDMEVLLAIAISILKDDFSYLDNIKAEINNKWCGKFLAIIPENWFSQHRYFCGKYCTDNGYGNITNRDGKPIASNEETKTPVCNAKRIDAGTGVKEETKIVDLSYIFRKYKLIDGLIRFYSSDYKDYAISEHIKAVKDGIVFYVDESIKNKETGHMETYVMVYVVSRFDDYNAFRKWYMKNGRKQLEGGRGAQIGNTTSK